MKVLHRTGLRRLDLHLVDINCIAYVALVGAGILLFREHVPTWHREIAIHAGMLLAILAILSLDSARPANRIVGLARLTYPFACLAIGWNEVDRLAPMAFGSYWATEWLLWADRVIFGVPPIEWCQSLYRPWLDELMNIFYSGFFLFTPVVCLPLLLRGRRRELLYVLSIMTFTYFVNYLLFYVFPALSPRMIPGLIDPSRGDFTGFVFASVTRVVQANGSIRGGCFPSVHVAAAIAWTFAASRIHGRLGLVLAPVSVGVVFATVYLRYHHAVDSIAGIAVGLACTGIAERILRRSRLAGVSERATPIWYDEGSHGVLHPSRREDAQPEGDRSVDPVREAQRRDRGLRLG